ncbi:MAG: ATP-binding cassette domain-containing protein [Patescibacteria group bacterium]|nr:ATP-binding cassette domain-containing protein [Patescibacteria group bacterium]
MPEESAIIKVVNLTKKFGDLEAVREISFEVERGSIFAFLGPNGAGKTTTIKMLTTLLKPTSGQILINGFNPLTQQDEVRRSFGIVFQDPSLDDELTAKENMEFHSVLYSIPASLKKHRIEELLKFTELWERKDDLVKNFSGGMRRRLEIARGLLHHPKILFLDEPTLGLDPQTRNHIWAYIKNLNQKEKITVFFTTHYIAEAEQSAGKVAIIDHGQIIERGTPEEIIAQAKAASLEDAFIAFTGKEIREEAADSKETMRSNRRAWRHR